MTVHSCEARGRYRRRTTVGLASILVAAGVLTGCSLNPGTLATSAQSFGAEETVTLKFESILNLTDGADVMLNGVKIGHVRSVALTPNAADVVVALAGGMRIPTDARAAIRQSTVLGDSFVSLEADSSSSAGSAASVIPLSQTTAPPPLENTLSVLANFVNGGSIGNLQDVVNTVNKAFPSAAQTRKVADIAAIDLASLSRNTTRIDTMLGALTSVTSAINSRSTALTTMLSPEGMSYWRTLALGLQQVGIVLPSVGSVFEGGAWLTPMLMQVNGSVKVLRGGIDAVGTNSEVIRKFLTENLFPFIRRPDFTIVSAESADGRNILDGAERILRMLGATK